MQSKACSKCGEIKPLDAFYKEKRAGDGRRASCGACDSVMSAAYGAANREVINKQKRAYRAANREAVNERTRAYRKANRELVSVQRAVRIFGIPEKQAAEMATRSCEICGLPPGSNAHRHHVDHDHSMEGPESVRGVLCSGCNASLGYFEKGKARRGDTDNPLWVASAEVYLQRHKGTLIEL